MTNDNIALDPARSLALKMKRVAHALNDHIDPGVQKPAGDVINELFQIVDDGETPGEVRAVLEGRKKTKA
jgi:hypothetical protein